MPATECLKQVKVEDLAYIAGLFDGDGSVGLHRCGWYKLTGEPKYTLRIRIANSDVRVLEWIRDTVGFGWVKEKKPSPKTHWTKRQYEYTVTGRKARRFAEMILPYLRIKRNKVETLLDEVGGDWPWGP